MLNSEFDRLIVAVAAVEIERPVVVAAAAVVQHHCEEQDPMST